MYNEADTKTELAEPDFAKETEKKIK